MSVSQTVVDEMMARCGRHCCICRRFRPTHLIVHHIVERENGGSDDPENLIVVCLTCHSDVHALTSLSRRFTYDELRRHRQTTYELVLAGRLRAPEADRGLDDIINDSLRAASSVHASARQLPGEAVRVLLAGANGNGSILAIETSGGLYVQAGGTPIAEAVGREAAKYRAAIRKMEDEDFIESSSDGMYRITHDGYLAADEYMAMGATKDADVIN